MIVLRSRIRSGNLTSTDGDRIESFNMFLKSFAEGCSPPICIEIGWLEDVLRSVKED